MRASYNGKEVSSQVSLTINRAPWGGTLAVSPDGPYLALTTVITLTAKGWVDPDDLLLTYSFSYRAVNAGTALSTQLTTNLLSAATSTLLSTGNWSMLCSVADDYGA